MLCGVCHSVVRLPPPMSVWTDAVVNKHGGPATITHMKYSDKVTKNKDPVGHQVLV